MFELKIGNFTISHESETFIIAELSANHNQNISIAKKTIEFAAKSGANAIKLQTYTPETITLNSKTDPFRISGGTIWDGNYLYDLYQKAYTPWEWHEELFALANSFGLEAFSSPFDSTAVEFLETLNVPAYKIASFEITDIPLIQLVASKMKPIIISTGIATLNDIILAIEACKKVGNSQIILLKCTSTYPAPLSDLNLCMIKELRDRFNVWTGFSDHSLGNSAPFAAVALGAKVIEKHLILDKEIGGPDSTFSQDASGFESMINGIREIEHAIGTPTYDLSPGSQVSRKHARSIFVSANATAGDEVNLSNIRSVRPNNGLDPIHLEQVLGKKFSRDVNFGEPLKWDMLK